MGGLCCKPEHIDFEGPVDLYHFHLLRAVGKGAFGKVRVVQHKQTKQLYALKYINKAKCVKMRAVSNIIQERRLLEEIESPFICNLRYAFQDDENMFMVLDLMLGGDLRFHLDRTGNMREDVVRFYVAELAVGLDNLHTAQIIHRDLKPDNVLLDEKGHAHLTDFNIAVHFTPRRPLTSIAGSMAYMAPEVLSKRGYISSIDWWSLGVMAYELLFGRRPYRGKTNSALTHSILNDRCHFPENVDTLVSAEAVSCVRGLLERDVKKRMGCREGIREFKSHPWFAGMDWQALETKRMTPPFEPDSKKANFDATHELEELLLEDNPLKAKKRDEKRDVATLSPEYQQMEESFLQFDYLKQRRRSYFKGKAKDGERSQRSENEAENGSTTSSAGFTLADQPFAETGAASTSHGASLSAKTSTENVSRNGHGIEPSSGSQRRSARHQNGHVHDMEPIVDGVAGAKQPRTRVRATPANDEQSPYSTPVTPTTSLPLQSSHRSRSGTMEMQVLQSEDSAGARLPLETNAGDIGGSLQYGNSKMNGGQLY